MIWVGYTTRYREGGPKFARAAKTMAARKRAQFSGERVACEAIESKRDFVDAMTRIADAGETLRELHFIGHSGMYGPMFRSTQMPEQFSPHEWRALALPFAKDGAAYFHACRTARWFAPFFAYTFGVPAHGYHWYTTISRAPDRFVWDAPLGGRDHPVYIVALPGRKSHGLVGSLGKYLGVWPVEPMKRFLPSAPDGDTSYDAVAALYDRAFEDIRVRRDEWNWLSAHLPTSPPPSVLDIGCGNGALLSALAPRLARGVGVDRSGRILELARRRCAAHPQLSFETIDGPRLPFPDASFDVVISMLSFRYLDWDPIMNEIRRVLRPGGRILLLDMVTAPLKAREAPAFLRGKIMERLRRARQRQFSQALEALVSAPAWKTMLKYNPIRAEHELKWYLESRFPGRRVELLNVGWDARVLAFDSGPLEPGWVAPQSYP